MMILAGDIGGTKTRLGLFSREQGPNHPIISKKYSSPDFSGLEHIVRTFIHEYSVNTEQACFGVAGPVKNSQAAITNLSWTINSEILKRQTGIKQILLLNDLQAMAYAVPYLENSMLETINPGIPAEEGTKALVAAGTGLGEVFLTWGGCRYQANSSEGGHTDFGPRTDLEVELLNYMRKSYDHVSYERVCSGIGIPNLYAFLRDTRKYAEPPALARKLALTADQTPVIVDAGLNHPEDNPICAAVLELFTSILGAEAGNLAMKVASYGGIYIGGGIPPKIAEYIHKPLFLEAFKAKGRLTPMIDDIPIYLVTHKDVALMGAACHAIGW